MLFCSLDVGFREGVSKPWYGTHPPTQKHQPLSVLLSAKFLGNSPSDSFSTEVQNLLSRSFVRAGPQMNRGDTVIHHVDIVDRIRFKWTV